MSKIFTITDLAREFGITPRSIRHYEDEGLLSPTRNGQQRVFTQRDRVRLQLIQRGKSVGFSLAEIKEILDLYDLPHGEELQAQVLKEKIADRRTQLHQQQKDLEHMLEELDVIENRILPSMNQ
jgi:DNA-binding transcriptional MerR regulator